MLEAALELKGDLEIGHKTLSIIISELDRSGIDDGYAILLMYAPMLFQNLNKHSSSSSLSSNSNNNGNSFQRSDVDRMAIGLRCLSTLYQMAREQLDEEISKNVERSLYLESEVDDDDIDEQDDVNDDDNDEDDDNNDEGEEKSKHNKKRKVTVLKKRKSISFEKQKKKSPISKKKKTESMKLNSKTSQRKETNEHVPIIKQLQGLNKIVNIDSNGVYEVGCYEVATWADNCDALCEILSRPKERLIIDHIYVEDHLGEANIRVLRHG